MVLVYKYETEKVQINQKSVVIVDDEPDIIELVNIHLTKNGYRVRSFENWTSAMEYLNSNIPDLIILDLMLPDADGLEVCKTLKKDDRYNNIPVIMLTARTDEMDRVLGLEIGADDYITKPFSPRELVARVKAVLRRVETGTKSQKINIGGILDIDLQRYEVNVNNNRVDLTSTEFRILRMLAERKGWVYSRESILEELGGYEKGVLDRTVDVHIKNIREKLGPAARFIKNIRGIGYKIEE
ncbi:MAG TPA: response regulator transcription factor [Candidatus Kapabacteria bacterium]|jgi:two-component system phosphate regulon response regulator PhoB/two-component system alkaline phosphatase synthesis response regulator PhoP|nr:response regulator transcription factor [Candidatus Kapabacteria bacterium]HOV92362.1 response regulator transcription factor [Candidatus Kapabacteria bacterium]